MIDVNQLKFFYPNKNTPAVNDISFSIGKGEIFGFLGPSGAGKTTTQKILMGLLRQYQGEINIFGNNLHKLSSNYYEKIGVSFEMPNHYGKLTALENLNFFASLYKNKTTNPLELLDMVGLKSDANVYVRHFSKGMKMRLNFIRALLNNPDLLFLDEPTSGLDPVNAKIVKDIILTKKSQGKTVFLTTHNMTVADQLCDRVAFIIGGKITLIDSPKKLKVAHGQRSVAIEYVENNNLIKKAFPLDQLSENQSFIEIIKTKQISTMHTLEATLEDIFIKATGKNLD